MKPGDLRIGDLIFTNFFGEPYRTGIILKINSNMHGRVTFLTLLSDGQQVYFRTDQIITPLELEKES
jgi:hypothetical protein